MTSLEGVCEEWEACATLRERMRVHSKLVVPEPLYDQVVVSVKVADLNYDALKPLACRLKQEDGTVGQHSLSAILKQTLEGH